MPGDEAEMRAGAIVIDDRFQTGETAECDQVVNLRVEVGLKGRKGRREGVKVRDTARREVRGNRTEVVLEDREKNKVKSKG